MQKRDKVYKLMQEGQNKLVTAFSALGEGEFKEHSWERPGGGGGTARVLERGSTFERAGVNVSAVYGEKVPDSLAKQHEGTAGKPYFATGISMCCILSILFQQAYP